MLRFNKYKNEIDRESMQKDGGEKNYLFSLNKYISKLSTNIQKTKGKTGMKKVTF